MSQEKVTLEDIQKALATLAGTDELNKGKKEAAEGTTNAKVDEKDGKDKEDDKDEDKEKAKKAKEAAMKKAEDDKAAEEAEEAKEKEKKKKEEEAEKAKKEGMKKGESTDGADTLEKALDVNPALKQIHTMVLGLKDDQNNKGKATAELMKGLMERLDSIAAKVEAINAEPGTRKAITTRPTERFNKGEGEGEPNAELGKTVLHIAQHKNQILEIMDAVSFDKGQVDSDMASAMSNYELTGQMSRGIAAKLKASAGITVIE